MGSNISMPRHYAAFISYAHADEIMAARLHKALETYPVPRHLRAEGKATKPVFRDVAELTAAHSLSEEIRDAVKASRVLIVLCSPAAKASHWVNEEIRFFRALHGDAAILSAIIEGNPDTAFPEALTEGGREPLAAALGSDRAGFKLGVTQLAAGMLETGLDDLVQRGAKRRQRILGAGLAASLALSGVMGFTALQAIEARNEAELERTESEALLEYMVKDLKVKLEPVGRLELLEGVGRKAIEYYDKKDIADLSDDNLRLLAAARQVIAQVALDAGRMEEAQKEIEASAALTREVLDRNPDDTDAIYAHAQSEYWVADYNRRQGNLAEMEKPLREYDRLAQILYKKDPTNFDWVMEAGWGKNNLGQWAWGHATKSKTQDAIAYYSQAITYFKEALMINPDSKSAQYELSNTLVGRASAELSFGTARQSRRFKLEELEYLTQLIDQYPNDKTLFFEKLKSELDYYHDFFLVLSEKQEKDSRSLLNQIYDLTLYDPENLTYKLSFLEYSFEYISKTGLPPNTELTSNISNLISLLPNNHSIKDYYEAMLKVVITEQDSLSVTILTQDDLNKLPKEKHWKIAYLYFLRNKSLETGEVFLSTIKSTSNLPFPTYLAKQMKTHLELNNCFEVSSLSQVLSSRGFNAPSPRQTECKASIK